MAKVWGLTALIFVLIFLLALIFYPAAAFRRGKRPKLSDLACRDETGAPVDWAFVYKPPSLEDNSDTLLRTGYGSLYVTAKQATQWTRSTSSMNSTSSVIGATIAQVYGSPKLDLLIAYNDQNPVSYRGKRAIKTGSAHAKGLLVFSGGSGFWLMHSVPHFPSLNEQHYTFPHSGTRNGQNLLCLSLTTKDAATVNRIAEHLMMMQPRIYEASFGREFVEQFPLYKQFQNRKWKRGNNTASGSIYTKQRTEFMAFSKSRYDHIDIYSEMIAPHFEHDLSVQSWRNGAGGKLPSDCQDKYKVMNVQQIQFSAEIDWKYSEDHSKWAASTTDNNKIVCIADLNRVHSQFVRGGGALCLSSGDVWSRYSNITQEIDSCPLFG